MHTGEVKKGVPNRVLRCLMELWSHLGEGVSETSRQRATRMRTRIRNPFVALQAFLTKKRVDHALMKRSVLELKSWGRKEEGF
ncbi:unnamed protein product [Microthlaspi erraticum]|uniref:Uncharacterized protein n=1 Tax=Microthlaspi erraticum TaxID=1685480 RepID=A0A6D2JXQ8_9BRAS|nr:unnamed protein product [Microthlaspi erraticum]